MYQLYTVSLVIEYQRKNLKRPAAVGQSSSAAASFLNNALPGSSNTMPVENKKKKKKRKSEGKRVRLHVTSSLSFQAEDEEFRDMLARTTPRTSSKEDMLDTSSVGPKVRGLLEFSCKLFVTVLALSLEI